VILLTVSMKVCPDTKTTLHEATAVSRGGWEKHWIKVKSLRARSSAGINAVVDVLSLEGAVSRNC
jgi:hypothetical protein